MRRASGIRVEVARQLTQVSQPDNVAVAPPAGPERLQHKAVRMLCPAPPPPNEPPTELPGREAD
eukprot:682590-Alexandrium_andersonii.AAC.1